MKRIAAWHALLFLSLPRVTAAADGGFEAVSGGKLAETLLGLGVVLALIFVLAKVLQRMQGSVGGGNAMMRVVSSLSIGARERILLLQVADKHILVAATPQAISPLHVFDELPEAALESTGDSNGFASLLQSINPGSSDR